MFKRNKGYFLLTMLVLTGLAGRLHSDTLSGKERHYLVNELKNSNSIFFENIAGLSKKQFNFKSTKDQSSIKESVYQMVFIENNVWALIQKTLQQNNGTNKITTNDESLLSGLKGKNPALLFKDEKINFRNIDEALKLHAAAQDELLRYIKTTTENVRKYTTQTSFGSLDVYQLLLLINYTDAWYTDQIKKIKLNPKFPK